jgi:hypothetical protein
LVGGGTEIVAVVEAVWLALDGSVAVTLTV